jgi:hypothetical protein
LAGIGRREDSSAHQHEPDRLQVNSVPQLEQPSWRERALSDRFVMNNLTRN